MAFDPIDAIFRACCKIASLPDPADKPDLWRIVNIDAPEAAIRA